MSRSRTWRLLLAVCLITGVVGSGNLMTAAKSAADGCDTVPTGVDTTDHWLHFEVPVGLMPDPQFDRRPAKLQVHRVRPVYSHGKCPGAIYNALPASMTNKVLVQVGCASHDMPIEGCSGARCTPASGTPYGGSPGQPWAGPHATVKAALIEWITSGTFNGAASERFTVNDYGVASASP